MYLIFDLNHMESDLQYLSKTFLFLITFVYILYTSAFRWGITYVIHGVMIKDDPSIGL